MICTAPLTGFRHSPLQIAVWNTLQLSGGLPHALRTGGEQSRQAIMCSLPPSARQSIGTGRQMLDSAVTIVANDEMSRMKKMKSSRR